MPLSLSKKNLNSLKKDTCSFFKKEVGLDSFSVESNDIEVFLDSFYLYLSLYSNEVKVLMISKIFSYHKCKISEGEIQTIILQIEEEGKKQKVDRLLACHLKGMLTGYVPISWILEFFPD